MMMMNAVKDDSKTSGFRGAGLALAILAAVFVAFLFLDEEATAPGPRTAAEPAVPEVLPFFPSAEAARPFPEVEDPARYSIPVVAQAYRIAREIPDVLAQLPCYCGESFGHRSLLDCFATDHGAT